MFVRSFQVKLRLTLYAMIREKGATRYADYEPDSGRSANKRRTLPGFLFYSSPM